MPDALLQLDRVTIRFGGLTAVSDVDLNIHPGELVGLIGPNGAGKTTVFNLITGVYQPTEGQIHFAGQPTRNHPPHSLTRRGIARTFQNIRLFSSLSVLDNVRVALQLHRPQGIPNALWRGQSFRSAERDAENRVLELLQLFQLADARHEPAKALSYGNQRRLEIVRALATQPKLLLLDEPAAGMNPTEKATLADLIRFIQKQFQLSILLVEHDMRLVMGVCQRLAVLDHGMKIAEGSPDDIRKNRKVIEAYLGDDSAAPTPSEPPRS